MEDSSTVFWRRAFGLMTPEEAEAALVWLKRVSIHASTSEPAPDELGVIVMEVRKRLPHGHPGRPGSNP